jgi:hypothetical protein
MLFLCRYIVLWAYSPPSSSPFPISPFFYSPTNTHFPFYIVSSLLFLWSIIFSFFSSLYHFCIYLHVYTLFVPPPPSFSLTLLKRKLKR